MTALTPEDPQRLGDYWIATRLGSGGQGVVYEAYDRGGARVALKTLHRDAEPFVRERFAKEAEAARKVAPFCTARILDVSVTPVNGTGPEGGVPYIVSEYIPGPTLASHVHRHGPLDPDAVLRLAIGASTALAAIHSAGVIHRDLKPGNVLLGPDGPRIIDFGIARTPDMSLTATGALMGTLGYMAPEVLSGRRATTAADIFAWGAVVLFAASGDEPFRGAHIGEVAHRTASVDPDLSVIPVRIRPLIASALAKEPDLRPNAQELLTGLIGGPDKAGDPRGALLAAGARRATTPEDAHVPAENAAPLGARAEAAFTQLSPAAQPVVQQLLLRLVAPGEASDGSQDSVRTVSHDELYAERPDSERRATETAVTALAGAGILEVSEGDGSVRFVSAALIPAWRRLRDTVDADRPRLLVHRALGRAALQWQAHGEHTDDLPHGTALRTFLDWLTSAPFQLRPSPLEIRFLDAAREASARTARRRRQLLAGVAVLTALTLIAGTFAWFQSRESERRGAEAKLRRDQATSRSVAQAADSLRGSRPDTALLLSLAAWRIAPTPEAQSSLSAAATQRQTGVIDVRSPSSAPENGQVLLDRGRTFMTFTEDKTEFWDLTGGQEGVAEPRFATAVGTADLPSQPLVSRDGRLLLKAGTSGAYQLVSTRDGKPFGESVPHQPGFQPAQLSNKGHVLFSGGNPQTGEPVTHRFFSPGSGTVSWTTEPGNSLTLSPDGTHFASCVYRDTAGNGVEPLKVWAIRPGKTSPRLVFSSTDTRAGHRDDVRATCGGDVGFSADGSLLGLREGDRFFVWSTADGRPRVSIRVGTLDETSSSAHLSADGNYVLASSEEHPIAVWDLSGSSVPLFRLADLSNATRENNDHVFQMALDEQSKTLTYLTYSAQQVHRLDLSAALSTGGQGPDIEGAALSADGRTGLYRKGTDAPVQHFLDLRTGRETSTPVPQRVGPGEASGTRVSSLSPDGGIVAFTDFRPSGDALNLSVSVWDRRAHKELLRAPVPDGRDVFGITLSRDNRYVAFNSDYAGVPSGKGAAIDVWDVRAGKRVHRYAEGQNGVALFSQDSRRLVTTEGDVLDLATGTSRRVDLGSEDAVDLAFSPDGELLAVVRATGWVDLWDSEVRHRLARMPSSTVRGGIRSGASLSNVVFSADGGLLAAIVNTETVQLWDVDARLSLGQPLDMGGRDIDAMAFDGSVLHALSGSRAQSVDLSPGPLAATVCRKAGRDITRQEWRTYVPDLPYRSLC
ncbi:serine/threonine-protein kinase [Streptomyces sp. NPDC033538]|uniref:serine/threonine-protein kinase n=1 Tax=Streptomyces sp. NPDC033538 TaxID=3155367 RepID=UPI0033F2D747